MKIIVLIVLILLFKPSYSQVLVKEGSNTLWNNAVTIDAIGNMTSNSLTADSIIVQDGNDTSLILPTKIIANQLDVDVIMEKYPSTAGISIEGVGVNNGVVVSDSIEINGRLHSDSTITIGTSSQTNITIDATNGIKLNGGSTIWRHVSYPFTRGNQGITDYPPFNMDSMYYEFSVDSIGNDENIMHFIIHPACGWKEGSTIYPHVHYKYETGVGSPVFIFKYKWYNTDSTTNKGFTWVKTDAVSSTINNTISTAEVTSGISGVGMLRNSILIMDVYLYSTTGTPPVNSYGMFIDMEANQIGDNDND